MTFLHLDEVRPKCYDATNMKQRSYFGFYFFSTPPTPQLLRRRSLSA